MVNIRTTRTKEEIEEDWIEQGFEKIFEDDEQIWVNQRQDELLFVSWTSAVVQVYKYDYERILDIE